MKFFLLLFTMYLQLSALQTGETLPLLTLKNDEGGNLDGTPFSSDALKGRVNIIFYVDPDEKDMHKMFINALRAEAFDLNRFASVAIINMDATWLPNFAIAAALKQKQEEFPHTLYVKDMHKKGERLWRLSDKTSDIIITDKKGTVIYVHKGEVPKNDYESIFSLIKEHL